MDELATQPNAAPDRSTPRPRSRWRLLWLALRVLLVLGAVGGLLLGASFVVRSQWFLRSRIDPKLAEMGERLHGEFSYASVAPAGLTGIVVSDLRFEPDVELGDEAKPVQIERLVVYPDLAEMIVGNLQARALEIHGVELELWLDGGASGRGHWPWLEQVVENWSQPSDAAAGGGGGDDDESFPEIRVYGGRVSLSSPGGTMPHMGMRLDEVGLVKRGEQVDLEGAVHVDGLGYALLSGDANRREQRGGLVVQLVDRTDLLDFAPQQNQLRELVGEDSRLELSGVTVQWPPAVIFHDVRLSDTHLGIPGHEGAYVQAVGASSVRLSLSDGRADIAIRELEASVRTEWLEPLGAVVPVWLPSIDIVADFVTQRIGLGCTVGDESHGTMTVNAALDLQQLDLAVQIIAERYDAGPALSFVPYTGPIHVARGTVDGHASLRFPLREGLVHVESALDFEDLELTLPWLSDNSLAHASLGLDGAATVDLHTGTLTVDPSLLRLGSLFFGVEGSVVKTGEGRHVIIDAKLRGEQQRAEDLLTSLPTGFAPALEGYELSGHFGLAFSLALDTRMPDRMKLEHELDVSQLKVVRHGPNADIPLLASADFAVRVHAASVDTIIGPKLPNWTPYFRVSKLLPQSLIASEDGRFYSHNGFDTSAITASLVQNLRAGQIVRGGSTISQQVVKNLFLDGKKTVSRKFQEAFLTWQLEEHVDKERIMELYINLAHWGPDLYGIKDAAEYYFGKRPSKLSLRECLFLAAILPNPVLFGGQYVDGFIRSDRLNKMRNVLLVLYRKGVLSEATYLSNMHAINRANVSSSPRPRKILAETQTAQL